MSITSASSPRFASGDLSTRVTKHSEVIRRRSRRLSLANLRTNSILEGSITHVDVFLGSLTAISEQLAASLAENAKQRGAEVTMRSLEGFNPKQYLDSNSILRSTSRLAVFVVSTHVAGKPSPNAEGFFKWLRETPATVPAVLNPVLSKDAPGTELPMVITASAPPKNSSPSTSPRKHQLTPPKPGTELHRDHSFTDAILTSFRENWRLPFGNSISGNKPDRTLQGVRYAVFGVGNSIYRTYNATAKYVDSRLEELGAMRVCPIGLGDVSKGIEMVFAKWEAQLLQTISSQSNHISRSAPATARETLSSMPPCQDSLPSLTANTKNSVDEIVAGQPVMHGPIPTDLEPSRPRRYGEKQYQRRYTHNNGTAPITRRVTLNSASMPPLTDRR